MARMDRVNRQLLDLLQKDGRMSLTDLARQVGRSETTVRDRLASLQSGGVLRGYQAMVDESALGYHMRAYVHAHCDLKDLSALEGQLAAIPQVMGVSLTGGPRPLLIEVLVSDIEQLANLLETRLAPLGLESMEVEPVLRTLMRPRGVPVGTEGVGAEPVAASMRRLDPRRSLPPALWARED